MRSMIFLLPRARGACLRSVSRLITYAAVLLCGCLWLACGSARAQVSGQGSISGTVTDPSGAVIVNAQVTVTNQETNVSQAIVTNSTGYFEVDNLNPGVYKISVSAPQFVTLVRNGITLDTNARLQVPMALKPGSTGATITVSADATLLNTESASTGQALTTQQIQNLSYSGSDPSWLELMAPGVQTNVSQAASSQDGGGVIYTGKSRDLGSFGSIGSDQYTIDGAPNMMNARTNAVNLSPDDIDQIQEDVTEYDSSVGKTLGVSVTETTKSGTNELHGAVRETYSDQRWAALGMFQGYNYRNQQAINGCYNGPATSPACYAVENKYGNTGVNANNGDVAIGGPIDIPKVINGHNKLFFFFGSSIDQFAGVGGGSATVPTQQELTGNFSDWVGAYPGGLPTPPPGFISGTTSSEGVAGTCPTGTPYYGQYQIYNPFSVVVDSHGIPRRTPFCGNVIPAGLLANSAFTQFYNNSIPAPNSVNFGGSNYAYTVLTPQTWHTYTTREDWKFTPNDDVFARYTWQRYTKTTNSPFTANLGREAEARWIQMVAVGWNHVFNSNTNLDITWGANEYDAGCCHYPGYQALSPTTLGLPSYTQAYAQATAAYADQLPVFNISSYTGMGFYNAGEVPNESRDSALTGTLTHVMGHHTLRAGAEWWMQNYSQQVNGNVAGTYTFDDTYTQENNGSDSTFPTNNFVNSYAGFLMGVNTSQSASRTASYSYQSPYYGVYAEDTWRVTPKMVIIPGLRFEQEDGLVEKHNQQIVGWNPTASLASISGPANTAYAATLAAATPAQLAVLPTSLNIQGGPIFAGVNGAPRTAYVNSYRVLPRFGITYQLKPRVLIRGGYGLYFDTMNALTPQNNQSGFSATTSQSSSTNFGQTFVAPLSNPFPANASGANFNAPVGSSAGAMEFLGASGITILDHATTPARQNRGSVDMQFQFGGSAMLDVSYNVAYTSHILLSLNDAYTPASLYIGGQQPNTATATLLSQLVPNPFNIANFSGLATSNPAAYSIISHSNYYTAPTISVGSLVNSAYLQMSGFTEQEPIGATKYQEVLIDFTKRYSHGFTISANFAFSDQHDANFFPEAYVRTPVYEDSNNSVPTRFAMEEVWNLPFGKGNPWAQHGWGNAIFGGYTISSSYEAQPGDLVQWGNAFYVGSPTGTQIKIKHPIYNIGLTPTGGSNYIQWLNPGTAVATSTSANNVTTCTYSGNGFVTNASCQPNAYNQRVLPQYIGGVRSMGFNNVNGNVSRTFNLWERMKLQTQFIAYNIFNHQGYSGPNATPTSTNFGRVTGDGYPQASARWLSIQGSLRF